MTRRAETDNFRFEGFANPTTTPVPDVVFDRLLSRLGEAELKALLYIIRRTFGFKKDRDPISFNQFLRGITTHEGQVLDEGCGVRDRTTLSKALKSLEAKGIVVSEKGTDERGENVTTVYRLRFRQEHDAAGAEIPHMVVGNPYQGGVVGNSHHPGRNRPLPVVGDSYPQQTALQQTDRHRSKIRKDPPIVDKPESTHLGRGGEPTAIGAVVERVPLGEAVERWRQAREGEDSRTGGPGPAAAASGQRRGGEPPTVIRRRGRPRQVIQQDEDYQVLQAYMADFAREFNDRAPLKSSTTRLYNLLKRSGVSRDAFLDRLYAARAIVKERTGSIHGRGGTTPTGAPTKHTAAYFFAVLEDLLGLRTDEAGPTAPRRVG